MDGAHPFLVCWHVHSCLPELSTSISATSFLHEVELSNAGGVAPLVALARDGTALQREFAAAALCKLASNTDNKEAIAEAGGILPLIELSQYGTHMQKAEAAAALGILALNNDDNKREIVESGPITARRSSLHPCASIAHPATRLNCHVPVQSIVQLQSSCSSKPQHACPSHTSSFLQ